MDDGYDPLVYENTHKNLCKIFGMLMLYYLFHGLHWWANFELVVHATETSTIYNICVFGSAVLVIACMLVYGAQVNKKKLTHEFYIEKISAEKLRIQEEQARAAQKAVNDAKIKE